MPGARPVIRCVLFDLDGTLVDTWDLYVEAYIRTLAPYVGRRLTLEELVRLGPTSELRLLQRALTAYDAGAAHREFLRHYGLLHSSHFEGAYPGAREMLRALRDMGLRLGIVTGKSRGAWQLTAKWADLGAFDTTVTDEDVLEAKPNPAGLVLALDRLGVSAAKTIYVGDSVGDAKAARAAGALFAAALWPKAERELEEFLTQVREVGVWMELSTPQSLVNALKDLSH